MGAVRYFGSDPSLSDWKCGAQRLSTASWNARALNTLDRPQRHKKYKFLRNLAAQYQYTMIQEVHGVPRLVADRFATWFPEYEAGHNFGATAATGGVSTLVRKSDDIVKIEHVPFAAGRALRTVVYVKGSLRSDHHRHIL